MGDSKLVSFCLFTFNQEAFIAEALESALNQTYSPLEIIISDDCSSDFTFKVIEKVLESYTGPHKVILNRNVKNLGLGAHFSKVCNTLSSGEYIIVLGGDDISTPKHVERAVKAIEENSDVWMIDFNGQVINSKGHDLGTYQNLEFDMKRFFISDYLNLKAISSFAPGRIFKRALISEFNPISAKCPTEDSVLVLRSLLMGGLLRLNENLVYYRKHDNNLSSSSSLKKLSNLSIISQYYNDILRCFNDGWLDETMCENLLRRVNLELQIRKTSYQYQGNKMEIFKGRLKLKAMKAYYILFNRPV